jgi:hypothetical protein
VAYSTPPNFAAGAILTEANLDTLSDDIAFLANPPKCRVFNSANISIPNTTATALTFNSERFDTDTMHSTSVNTGRITFTTAGTYLVGGGISFASNATNSRQLDIRLNGATVIASDVIGANPADVTRLTVSTLYAFSATDYIEIVAYQSSGVALNALASANFSPEAWAIWQSL